MKRLVWLIALAPLSPFACSGGDTTTDAGSDAAHDSTTFDAPKDVAKDTSGDVTTSDASDGSTGDGGAGDAAGDSGSDAAADAGSDATTADAGSDATTADAGSDATTTDAGSDATTTDATADAPSDAAADGGSSWHTPTCNGTIGTGEYGDSNYQITSQTQTWYMTWDATNLYVALDPANVTEGTVLYVGFSGNGLTTGQPYDTTNGSLPFAADAVIYAKQGYQEIRLGSVDAGSWGSPDTTSVQFCDNNNATREEVIPWTALGASAIPASFRFLAYATSSGGSVYGQIPTSNPTGSIGTNATFGHDFLVSSTANGSGAFPFATTE